MLGTVRLGALSQEVTVSDAVLYVFSRRPINYFKTNFESMVRPSCLEVKGMAFIPFAVS